MPDALSKLPIHCFHGSPGTPLDFDQIAALLPGRKFVKVRRLGYPELLQGVAQQYIAESSILVGYSWGCVTALTLAAAATEVAGIILVSPFLKPKKSPSGLLQFFLSKKIIADPLLRWKGKSAIETFLVSSSAPQAVPDSYGALAPVLSQPGILATSMLEKTEQATAGLDAALRKIAERNIPVTVVFGDQDPPEGANVHVKRLAEALPKCRMVKVEQGGHALLWTHPQVIATEIGAMDSRDSATASRGVSKHGAIKSGVEVMTSGKIGYHPGEHVENNVFTFLEKHMEERSDLQVLQWASMASIQEWSANPSGPLKHEGIDLKTFSAGIRRVAAGYRDLGIEKGDRVIIFLPMSVHMYTAMFALQMIGAVAVFLDSWARRAQLGITAEIVKPKGIVTLEAAFNLLAGEHQLDIIPIRIVCGPATKEYTAHLEDLYKTAKEASPIAVEQEHTALITFTTGSSGRPKGANRTHRFLAAQHYAIDAGLPYWKDDRDLPIFPIFSLNNIASGVSTVLPALDVGTPAPHDAAILLAQIRACGVTTMTLNPWLLNELCNLCISQGIQLTQIRRVAAGGAAISRDTVERFVKIAPQAELWILYGSTEVEPIAHIEAKDMLSFQSQANVDAEWVDNGVNVGHFVEGIKRKLIQIHADPVTIQKPEDWQALEVRPGSVGELIVAGEHVCRDYWNDTQAFSRAKIRDTDQTVWHRTGDLVRIDNNGYIWLVGRIHSAIMRGSEYVFPVRAEIVLKKLDFVLKCAYLGMPDPELGQRCVCAIMPKDVSKCGDAAQEEAWAKEIRRIMAKNDLPVDQVVFRDHIPMDPRHHSKVEYDVLRRELSGT
jgi:olefin beta-lactone synthetase